MIAYGARVLNPVLYLTSVRVDQAVEEAWNAFYDEWIRAAVSQVPHSRRGSRWRVAQGQVDGRLPIPEAERPVYLGIVEYPRLDEFVLSRAWRKQPHWEPRVRSFDPWLPHLHDYATFNLIRVESGAGSADAQAMLVCSFTIDPERLQEFEEWQRDHQLCALSHGLNLLGWHRYVALVAQVHRYAGEHGELVVPQRHHLEDGGRLSYVLLFELGHLPDQDTQRETLDRLGAGLDGWAHTLGDRHEAFAERILLVNR